MEKWTALILLLAIIPVTFCGCGTVNTNTADDTKKKLLSGRKKVLVPKNPARIAAMTGPSYEMVFMLGAMTGL